MAACAENLEDSFQRNQRLEATTDDDVPPASRPEDGRSVDGEPTVYQRPAETADSSSEELSSRLTIEEYLMSDLRVPVSTGLDQYATSSFIHAPNREGPPARRAGGKASRQARRQALAENLAREKGRRRQPPPTGRMKKPPPTEREIKRLTRDRPWAEPPNRSRPRSAPASWPTDFVAASKAAARRTTGDVSRNRTAISKPHGGPAAARKHRAAASASVPRPRPASARLADQSHVPAITIQLNTARNKLRVQAGQISRLQKETSQKDRLISDLKEQVRTPGAAGTGRTARLAKKQEANRVTERKAARDTISKLKGDLKEARKRAVRAEAAVAASQRELKQAKEKRVSSAKQLRASLEVETAKRQRAEEELKVARSDIAKLTRQLRAEERKCSSLQAELTMERQRRTALLELSKKHGLDVKRRGSHDQKSQSHHHDATRDALIGGPTDEARTTTSGEAQGNLPRTPGGSLLSELRDRRLAGWSESKQRAASEPDNGGTATVKNDHALDMAGSAARVVQARNRVIERQQEEELRIRAEKHREAEGRAQSLRWASARSAVEDPSLAGGLGGNVVDETAPTVGERRFRAKEGSFTPMVLKHTEMQKLMTRLRDQAVRKQAHQSQTTTTATTDDSDAKYASLGQSGHLTADTSSASSGLNISAGLAANRSTGAGAAHRRPLPSYQPLELVGEPGSGSGSTSSSDFAYVITSEEQAKTKARLAGIKASTVRHTRSFTYHRSKPTVGFDGKSPRPTSQT